jgi:hypothetical protein
VNYGYNYNNVRANNNIVVNNKNYYNRFNATFATPDVAGGRRRLAA